MYAMMQADCRQTHSDRLCILEILLGLHSGPAAEQAATCDGVCATEPDYDVCHVASRRHSDHFCILVIRLSLCGGPAPEELLRAIGSMLPTRPLCLPCCRLGNAY